MRLEKPLMMVMHSEPFIVSGFALTIPNVFTILSTLGEDYKESYKIIPCLNEIEIISGIKHKHNPLVKRAQVLLQSGKNI